MVSNCEFVTFPLVSITDHNLMRFLHHQVLKMIDGVSTLTLPDEQFCDNIEILVFFNNGAKDLLVTHLLADNTH